MNYALTNISSLNNVNNDQDGSLDGPEHDEDEEGPGDPLVDAIERVGRGDAHGDEQEEADNVHGDVNVGGLVQDLTDVGVTGWK